MTAEQFVSKWTGVELSERAASHEHFIDLCRLLDQPTPAEADPTGESFTFEKAVKVVGAASKGSKGEGGFVDVWKKGFFGWEYKRKDKYKNLDEAYRQLYQYRDALLNPPLSVVCDIRTIEIRTHFQGYPPHTISIRLEEIPGKLEVLRRVFTNPDSFRATLKTSIETTNDLAKEFSELADALIQRFPPGDLGSFDRAGDPVAHFLMKVMFCLFAQDIGLLPQKLFTRLINRCLFEPEAFQPAVSELFDKMRKGGWYGNDHVEYFNGGLFDDKPPLVLNHTELNFLARAAAQPWHAVEPSIFGTLFERILDPKKRAQIGAHYTSKDDILLVIEPVIMQPLKRQWQAVQDQVKDALAGHNAEPDRKKRDVLSAPIRLAIENFRRHLGSQRVLDPACGSGNFLYVALQQLLDFEDEVVRFAAKHDISTDGVPRVRPTLMHGIEINPYAAELAQVVIWIGYLQWLHVHGISDPKRPILDTLQCIENRDAILDLRDKNNPKAAEWPAADFIVGNPPFLGSKYFRSHGIADAYLSALYHAFDIPRTSDLCCYWFALAGQRMKADNSVRTGLLATQRIRGDDNREVLKRITTSGSIFAAWSDREWTLDGAAVNVAIVCFSGSPTIRRYLDGKEVPQVNADLTSNLDLRAAKKLRQNRSIAYRGDEKGGPFDVPWERARLLLTLPNAVGVNNLSVVRPYFNGSDLNRRSRAQWVIDLGSSTELSDASRFEAPFAFVETTVKPTRLANRREDVRKYWWLHRSIPVGLLSSIKSLPRYVACCNTFKHWTPTFIDAPALCDSSTTGFARSDDYFFALVASSIHELWALRMGSQLEDRPRYTPTGCFETFPLPWPPGQEDVKHPAYERIAAAAKELNERRERWLNPPEWIEPIARRIDETDDFADVPAESRPLIRQSAIMAAAAKDARLKKRTLTNLYNERPTWLKLVHETLDRAVLAAYASTDAEGNWSEDWAAVWVDSGAGQKLPADHPLASERVKVDQAVLADLLRLNHARAGK